MEETGTYLPNDHLQHDPPIHPPTVTHPPTDPVTVQFRHHE